MEKVIIGNATLYLGDCMEGMKEMPDKAFDLAIVDPPYGIGKDGQKGCECKNPKHNRKEHKQKKWDRKIPDKTYFDELFRVTKNQIIWGANYFTAFLPGSMGWIFWDKGQDLNQSDGELAFSSFDRALRRKVINRAELLKEGTIHPTQKPIRLYKWLLLNYTQHNTNTILDTHMGSGSSVIACLDRGHEVTAYEIDPEYFYAACERIERAQQQLKLAL